MTTKFDSFANEYIVVDSNEFIETTMKFVRRFIAMRINCVRNNIEYNSHYNRASQNVALRVFHMTYECNMTRVYVDDIHDFVETYFAID
jgi:hypothetical protein